MSAWEQNGRGGTGYPLGDDDHARHCRDQAFPWCDTCKAPAVWSEGYGPLHSTAEHPFGSRRAEASYDHAATTREWWDTPLWTEVAS